MEVWGKAFAHCLLPSHIALMPSRQVSIYRLCLRQSILQQFLSDVAHSVVLEDVGTLRLP